MFILQGISYEEAQAVKKKHINPAVFNYYKRPVMIHQGHKQWLYDVNGRRYLDLFAGIVTVSVGHCHPYVCYIHIILFNLCFKEY